MRRSVRECASTEPALFIHLRLLINRPMFYWINDFVLLCEDVWGEGRVGTESPTSSIRNGVRSHAASSGVQLSRHSCETTLEDHFHPNILNSIVRLDLIT
jgi:hypothetical protein